MSAILMTLVLSQPLGLLAGYTTPDPSRAGDGHRVIQTSPPPQDLFDYVVIIGMNNASADSIFGSSDAPYLNSLASTDGYATGYAALAQDSVPNYLSMIAGDTFVSQECDPTTCPISAPNIVDQIEASGLTWKAWAEDYPVTQGCSLALSNAGYLARHFPFVYFQDINSNQRRCNNLMLANSMSSSGIETDDLFLKSLGSTSTAANYMWLTPDKCDDFHACSISTADEYLSQLVPSILSSYIFKTQNAALFIVTAEGTAKSCPCPGDYVPAIWAGPAAKTNYQSSNQYDHYSLLNTIETSWGLSTLTSNDGSATAMTEFLQPPGPQLSLSYTPTNPVTGQSMSLTATASSGTAPYTFSWNFGDGTANTAGGTSNPNTINHTYKNAGTYTVTVTAADSKNKLGSATSTITVATPLAASVSGPAVGTFGTSVTFTANPLGGTTPYTFSWNFGDGSAILATGPTKTASHTYSRPGTDNISLNVTDSQGRLASASTSITINAPSLIVIITGPNAGEQGVPIDLTATASGGTTPYATFNWDFGDGSTASGAAVIQTYGTSGTFSITVTVTDSTGATGASNPFSIAIAPPLQITSTSAAPSPTDAGVSITFTSNISGGVTPTSCKWTFGDGGTANKCSTNHTYSTGGSFTAILTATDNLGVSVTSNFPVTVNPSLTVIVSASPNPQPAVGGTIDFSATVSGGASPTSCSWDFGDGNKDTACATSHTYSAQGTYTAIVTVTDSLGITTISSIDLIVGTPLAVALQIGPNPTEPTVTVTFVATANGGTSPYTSYNWDFGDGSKTTTTNASTMHAYTTNGNFTATISVTDSNNQTASATVPITVKALLKLSASTSPTQTEVGRTVNFTASITGGVSPESCKWAYGDGATGNTCFATHVYSATGTFTATLNVTDALGITGTSIISEIVNNRLTIVAFASPNPTELGKTVTFTSSPAGGVGTATCTWNFGDGTYASGCSTTHLFGAPGMLTAIVSATDSLGVTATHGVTVTVNSRLDVTANATPNLTESETAVNFTAPTKGGVGTPACTWNFGDGSVASTCSASHSYIATGTFLATIVARDSVGITATSNITVNVRPRLSVSSITANPNPTELNTQTSFTATITGGVGMVTCSWKFGDGTMSTSCAAIHSYTVSGTFSATLTAIDSLAVTKTITAIVIVIGPLRVDFTITPTSLTNGQIANFNATATGGVSPFTFSWNFGDNSTGVGKAVTHAYASTGTFNVTVAATDITGKIASRTYSIIISSPAPPVFASLPTSQIVNIGESLNFTVTAADAQGELVSVTAESLPSGANFDPRTGEFSWIPRETGNFSVTFTATTLSSVPTSSSETIFVLVRPIPSQSCYDCSVLGIPYNDEIVISLTIIGVISILIGSLFIGSRDAGESRSEDTEVSPPMKMLDNHDSSNHSRDLRASEGNPFIRTDGVDP